MENVYELNTPDICAEIGKKLKNIRINANLTQKQLSEKSGISLMTISGFESGRSQVSLVTFIQLLRALEYMEMIEQHFMQPDPVSPRQLFKMKRKNRKIVRHRK